MTTLAADAPRSQELGDVQEYEMIAADVIYEGAAVGLNSAGYARPLVDSDVFVGFAEQRAENAAGAAGDVRVRVKQRGYVELTFATGGLTRAAVGATVYAQDDNKFALTGGSPTTAIGRVARYVSSTVAVVNYDALVARGLT